MSLPTVIAAALLGWLRGGSLRKLVSIPLGRQELIILALLLQGFLAFAGRNAWSLEAWAPGLLIASYLALIYSLHDQIKIPGLGLVLAGIILNLVVIAVNGGRMPVSQEALWALGFSGSGLPASRTFTHLLLPLDSIRAALLADVIPIPVPLPWRTVISLGDILIYSGIFRLIFRAMTRPSLPGRGDEC